MGRNENAEDGNDRQQDRGAAYPSGPVPPHERQWRHPSELGFAAVVAADAEPVNIGRTGRNLLGASLVGGALLLTALFISLQPTSPDPNAHDVIALTNSELRIASFDRAIPVTVDVPEDLPPPGPGHIKDGVGIMLPNGDYLITTISAIADIDAIDIRLTGGRTVRARVIQTYPDLSVAVLSISDQATSTANPEIDVMSIVPKGVSYRKGQLVMALVDVPRQLYISDPIDDLVISLRSTTMSDGELARVSEGAPIVDKTGRLIGLCTHSAGTLGFIPFVDIEKALDGWITDGEEPSSR